MYDDVEIRVVEGRFLFSGSLVDDVLDLNDRTYRVNGSLHADHLARVCFAAGKAFGRATAVRSLPLVALTTD